MVLTDNELKRIRDEEIYRSEVRRSFETAKPPPSFSQRVSVFLESKVGFWILTTVFAGIAATLIAGFSNWINRKEIEERQRAERARQDFDTVIKVVPMLMSENPGYRQIGLSLLNGLASAKSIQPEIAAQITSTLQSIIVAGTSPNASADARIRAGEIARLVDAATPTASTQTSSAPTSGEAVPPVTTTVAPAVTAVALPPRVYVQIRSDAGREEADKAVVALRAAGVLAPGIERVASVPRKTELRYCDEKMLDASRERIVQALSSVAIEVTSTPLPARLCGNVRPNHFELWLGSRN